MAPPAISPLVIPHTDLLRDLEDIETELITVTASCPSLSTKGFDNWLRKEHKARLELLQAAWSLCLGSYTGSEDVWFGCLTSNSSYYCHVSPGQPVRSLFDIQLAQSVEEINSTFWGAKTAVFLEEELESQSYDFALTAYLIKDPNSHHPGIGIHFKPSLVSPELAGMIAATVAKALGEIVLHIDSLIEDLDVCSDADIARIASWNSTTGESNLPARPIHHVISQMASQQPTSIAVSAWDGELTYHELDRLSSGLAIWLRQLGVGPEIFVSLVFDKSRWAVVAQLGVLKAGGAYFFINPAHPVHYSRDLGSSLNPIIAVCPPKYSPLAEDLACEVIAIGDEVRELLYSIPVDDEPPQISPGTSNAMYTTFTSGTTGVPKGIVTEHAAFYAMAMANGKALGINTTTRMLQFASYSFDVSNRDALVTLMFGGCVCIPSEDERLNDLAGFLARHSVNMASLTPSMASSLSPASCPMLQKLVLGGEPMTDSHISVWANHVQLFNAYGVSESTGIAALSEIKADYSPSNIGYGCGSNLWVVAIDQPAKLAPIGAVGELIIEGPSVSRGYLGDKLRTDKHFTTSSGWKTRLHEQFGQFHKDARAFCTGDLVRYNLDGSLQLMGRRDHQVKVNGQRLELTAVEHHVAACAQGAEAGFSHTAVVAIKENKSASTKLIAFLGRRTSREPLDVDDMVSGQLKDEDHLKASLKKVLLSRLPTYMVPSDFILLQCMPLTTSGKLNRLLLQNTAARVMFESQTLQYIAGGTVRNGQAVVSPKEKLLIQTWSEMLGIKDSSIRHNDCFFRRGGDSMAAIKTVASLREQGFVISVSDIFKYSILSEMASMLVSNKQHVHPTPPAPFSLLDQASIILDEIVNETNVSIDLIEDVYPCTHMQQGLIALTAQNAESYIGSYTWQLAEGIDTTLFEDAWRMTWLHNPILRSRMVQTSRGIFQAVMKTDIPWKAVADFTLCPKEIDISQGSLVRFYVSRESFRMDIHHALFDEWSLDLVLAQVERAYAGGKLETRPFSPFVRHVLQEHESTSKAFWRQEFSGLQAQRFPAISSRTGQATKTLVLEHFLQLDTDLSTEHTLSSSLRLAWAIVLWHQIGSDDVLFGSTVSGRNAKMAGIDQISGPTLATLPIRIKLPTDQTVKQGLVQVQKQFIYMMAHEQTGLSQISQYGKEAAEACNFQNLLVVQPQEDKIESSIFQSLQVQQSENTKAFASYPLVLICRPENGGVTAKMAFNDDVMTRGAGESLLRQLLHVTQQLVSFENMLISDVSLVPPQDMAMLKEWNLSLPKSVDMCVHKRIQQLCATQPQAFATHSHDLDLTYSQLDTYSELFVHQLVAAGVKKGDFVPILSDRTPWAPVFMLAVLKVGAAFVMLDLSHPVQRLRAMCSTINAKVLVSFEQHGHISDKLSLPVTIFDPKSYTGSPRQDIPSASLPIVSPNLDDPACVVFSSGSTGVPKGIVLSHGAMATSASVMRKHGELTPTSRVFHFASFAFDISIGEIMFTLAAGACICVPREEDRRNNPAKAAGDLKVTWALLTPSVINLFDPSEVPELEVLGSCGEPLSTQIVDIWAHRLKLFAMYAPAECTVISHIGRILPDTHHSSIGRSFGATSWVVDPTDHRRLVPIGTVGELVVEGPVVASGYINDRERTDQAFVTSPSWLGEFRSHSDRMYKTGDLVRQTHEGSLQFIGRKDDQVKLYGQRLEVGEVEHGITSVCTSIKTAAVECIKIPGQRNRACLVAFITPQEGGSWGLTLGNDSVHIGLDLIESPNDCFYSTISDLHTSLSDFLPSYMLPSYFIPLSHIPLSLSGKVNRRFLREFTDQLAKRLQTYQPRPKTDASEGLPLTEHERKIQNIVGEALNLDPTSMSMSDSFFGLGGDSISAMVVSMSAKRRGIHLPVASIFTHQTVSKIASACDPATADDKKTKLGCLPSSASPMDSAQATHSKLPSHLPQEIADNALEVSPATEFQAMTLYNFYNRYLWISLPHQVDEERLQDACDQLVQQHSILRTVFYTRDDKSIVQLTLRKLRMRLLRRSNIESMETYCADDSLAAKVPIDGEPGVEVHLLELQDSKTLLLFRLPHALFDGMSLSTICEDLSSAYSGSPVAPCSQFSVHLRHVSEKRTPETYNVWRDVLGDTPMTDMNYKSLNRLVLGDVGLSRLSKDTTQATVITAKVETASISPPPETTMATLVKLAWAITLSRLFTSPQSTDESERGLSDVVFGQVVHGRGLGIPHEDRIVGPCLNIIPVRVHFTRKATRHDLLSQVQHQHIQTMPVENLGLGEIARNCTSWAPGTKFGSFVRFQNFTKNDDPTCDFDGQTCETGLFSLPNKPSNTANVLVVPHGSRLIITMTISSRALDQELADYVVGYLGDVIESLAEEADCRFLVQ